MLKHKKVWSKKNIVVDIGKCKFCGKDMVNTDSFVAFYPSKHKAHYICYKEDAEKPKTAFDW
jgi:hypothetical protein|tara:strand:+ start:307 stop:492 length:186 start_codon:yes stop_codon:yes gene_type:complete